MNHVVKCVEYEPQGGPTGGAPGCAAETVPGCTPGYCRFVSPNDGCCLIAMGPCPFFGGEG